MSKIQITSFGNQSNQSDSTPKSGSYMKKSDMSQEYDNPAYSDQDHVTKRQPNGMDTHKVCDI